MLKHDYGPQETVWSQQNSADFVTQKFRESYQGYAKWLFEDISIYDFTDSIKLYHMEESGESGHL